MRVKFNGITSYSKGNKSCIIFKQFIERLRNDKQRKIIEFFCLDKI